MAEKNNATCSICGRDYYKCISCKDMIKINPWKIYTDTSEHYKIHQVLHGYSTGVYTKEEAKSKLQMVDLSDFDSLRDNIKNIINDIMSEVVNEESVSVVDNVDVCLQNDCNTLEERVEESPVFEKTVVARKRKSYKVVETE